MPRNIAVNNSANSKRHWPLKLTRPTVGYLLFVASGGLVMAVAVWRAWHAQSRFFSLDPEVRS